MSFERTGITDYTGKDKVHMNDWQRPTVSVFKANLTMPIHHCGDAVVFEYPILQNGKVYSGDKPGPDRVLFRTTCDEHPRICGVITHRGEKHNDFQECAEKL